jgi:hypothetical protein
MSILMFTSSKSHKRPWHAWITLTCTAIAAWGSTANAQTPQAQFRQGGFIAWPWIEPFGHGGWKAWTCEDGTRIRLAQFNHNSNTPILWNLQDVLVPTAPDGFAPNDRLLRYISIEDDGDTGLAIGDQGMWCTSANAGDTSAGQWNALFLQVNTATSNYTFPRFPSNYPPTMWQSFTFETGTPPGGKYWIVGEQGLLATTPSLTNPVADFEPQCFAAGSVDPAPPQPAPAIDLRGIDFIPGTYRGAVCGGGNIWFNDVGADGNCWKDAVIHWTDDFGNPAPPLAGFTFWKLAFVPSRDPVADPDTWTGYAVGGVGNQHGKLFVTKDGGRSWTRERYECDGMPGCAALTPCTPPASPSCPPYAMASLTLGDQVPSALYGVSVFEDGSAIAVGYGSAMLERVPSSVVSARPWKSVGDRCHYPTAPLWGVACDPFFSDPGSMGTASDGVALVTGQANQVRRRTNTQLPGSHWVQDGWDQEWRLGRMTFTTGAGSTPGQVGWAGGQFFRIARTTDGGTTWTEQRAVPQVSPDGKTGGAIQGLAFFDDLNVHTNDDNGVAVGAATNLNLNPPYTPIQPGPPAVYYTLDGGEGSGGACGWLPASVPSGLNGVQLNFACSSGSLGVGANEFWACGTNNTVLHSTDGGMQWAVDAPPQPTPPLGSGPMTVNWRGIAFSSLTNGVVVGSVTTSSPFSVKGTAFRRDANGWTAIPITDSTGVTPLDTPLHAVHALGSAAIAVGESGHVFAYIGGAFRKVDAASALSQKLLLSVRLVANTPGNDVFVGGADGAFLRRTAGVWSAVRGKTNGDIKSLWFMSPTFGYFLAGGSSVTGANSCFMAWQ